MMSLLSSHLEDCSTPQYFCFSVRCEVCGEYWYSSSIPFSKAEQAIQHQEKKELYDAIYQREKERAKLAAGQEARERFSQCPVCRRLVCDACFLICDEMDLCRESSVSRPAAVRRVGKAESLHRSLPTAERSPARLLRNCPLSRWAVLTGRLYSMNPTTTCTTEPM